MTTLILSSLIDPQGVIVHQNTEHLDQDYVTRGVLLSALATQLGRRWTRCITDDALELVTDTGWTYRLEAREV